MPRQLAAMALAPIVQLFIEILHIQPVQRAEVPLAEGVPALALDKQPDESVTDVLAPCCKLLFGDGRVRRCPAIVLRLVRKEPRKLLPETAFEPFVVLFVRFCDERIRHRGVEYIRVCGADAKVYVVIFGNARQYAFNADKPFALPDKHGKGGRIVCARRIFEKAGAELLVFQKFAAHEPARPAVLVVDPRLHAQLFRLFQARPDAREPLFTEVFLLQPRPRVHDEPADTRGLHLLDLLA